MSAVLNHKVLILNANWFAIGTTPVKKALEDIVTGSKVAMRIEWEQIGEEEWDFTKYIELMPLDWDAWSQLSPRPYDEDSIHTPNMEIRVPTVVMTTNYNKTPYKTFRPTKRNIYEKYKGKDYWTGEPLSYNDCTLDHVVPQSKNGKNSWTNLAPTSGKINRLKGSMDAHEFTKKYGYTPQYKLAEPPPVSAQILISVLNPDWGIFLNKKQKQ